eukprot:NODE_255_length_1115_cov_29535.413696_g207_i0.p3 GENE.NODE_255_length_1115_cov_29535.413696_g207_i0~~NODE_255_length_1115_cov_29535.413696_g207_i0.p3  ORF type:complete len:51 (+),score=7.08 NODE_255_length_1115_cov_29535.413696_g207_i0:543-695(+)
MYSAVSTPSTWAEELRVVSSRALTSYDIRPVSPCHMRIGSGSAFPDIFCF